MYFPYDINFVYVVFRWILLALSSLFDQYLSKHWLDEFFRRLLVKTSATRLSCIGFRSFALDSNRSCWLSLSKVRCQVLHCVGLVRKRKLYCKFILMCCCRKFYLRSLYFLYLAAVCNLSIRVNSYHALISRTHTFVY